MDDIIIKVENLSHNYRVAADETSAAGERIALRDVSLEIRRGELVAA